MSYEIKRWKLAIAYGWNILTCIILTLLTIGLLFLCFLFSQIPAALPVMVLIVASFTPAYILMHYSNWQKLFQLYNTAWWINIDDQGIHVKKLFGHDHIKWQELSKVEKQFVIPSRLVFKLEPGSHRKTYPFLYKLETSSGQRFYIPEEMARSGTIVEQIKTKTNEAGVKPTFVLPVNPPLLSRNMTASLIAGVIPIITGCALLIIFQALLKSQSQEYRYGFIDKTGKLVIPAKFDRADDFSKYGTTVKIGDKWGCIDRSGHFIIQPTFNDDGAFYLGDGSGGLIRVNVNGKSGFMDWHGKQVIKPQFDAAGEFYDDVADIQLGKNGALSTKVPKSSSSQYLMMKLIALMMAMATGFLFIRDKLFVLIGLVKSCLKHHIPI
jgi:WG containing repeat